MSSDHDVIWLPEGYEVQSYSGGGFMNFSKNVNNPFTGKMETFDANASETQILLTFLRSAAARINALEEDIAKIKTFLVVD